MADPLISVIVPTYGRPEYLAEALESIKAQSYTRWEVIVVDDCSPEPVDVPEWATLVRHRRNMGLASARNTGLASASGELVTFLDDDDWFHPDRFAWAVDEIGDARTHSCLTGYAADDGTTTVSPHLYVGDVARQLRSEAPPPMGQCVHRASDVVQFNPQLRTDEDVEWWLRMGHAAVFAHHHEVGHFYRMHAGQMTRGGVEYRAAQCESRQLIWGQHHRTLTRAGRAHHARSVANTALWSGRRSVAARYAMRMFAARPSKRAAAIFVKAVTG